MDNKIYINNYYCRNSARISTIMEIRQYCRNAGRISKNFEILLEIRHCRNSVAEIFIVEIPSYLYNGSKYRILARLREKCTADFLKTILLCNTLCSLQGYQTYPI